MVSTVYLEADVAHAIDTIQWLGAKVAWITARPEKNGAARALLEVKSRRLTLVVFGTEVC